MSKLHFTIIVLDTHNEATECTFRCFISQVNKLLIFNEGVPMIYEIILFILTNYSNLIMSTLRLH
jgi:hypothetical protein